MPASRRRTAVVRPTTPAPTTIALTPPGPRARRAGARAAGRAPASSRGRCAWAGRGRRHAAQRVGSRPWCAQTSRANSRRVSASAPATCRGPAMSSTASSSDRGGEVGDGDRAAQLVGEEGHVAHAVGDLEGGALVRAGLRPAVDERGAHDQRVGRAQALGLELGHAVGRDGVRLVGLGERARRAAAEDDVAGEVDQPRTGGDRRGGDRPRALDVDARVVHAIGRCGRRRPGGAATTAARTAASSRTSSSAEPAIPATSHPAAGAWRPSSLPR